MGVVGVQTEAEVIKVLHEVHYLTPESECLSVFPEVI